MKTDLVNLIKFVEPFVPFEKREEFDAQCRELVREDETVPDAGSAFPLPDVVYPNGQVGFGCPGASLRDYFASRETLAEYDHPEVSVGISLMQALAGPKPDHAEGGLAMARWEARWRAALKYIRADGMLWARQKGLR